MTEDDPVAGNSSTLVDVLRSRALRQPTDVAYTYLFDGETEEVRVTYKELDKEARAIAVHLLALMRRGQHVILLYPAGLEFIAAFLGCLYAGAVAVPACLPEAARLKQTQTRLQAIASDAQPVVALTISTALPLVENLFGPPSDSKAMRWLVTDNIDVTVGEGWHDPGVNRNTLAFLQYTSGSTASPRGVMVSHGNLITNLGIIYRSFGHSADSRVVSWLPHYHDMGLVGGILQPLYGGFRVALMSPMAFLLRPFRWLQAISRTRATTSGGPNFAYDLCVRKITPEQRAMLDLSSWQVAFNGSEPVRADTLDRFATAFEPCGFRREAFYPCYGLAEATLFVTGGGSRAAQPVVQTLDEIALEHNKVEAVTTSQAEAARKLVGCGQVPQGLELAIVDPERAVRCAPDQVGEIWISGPSVALGYWNRPQETDDAYRAYLADTGEGPFLRTGDLGFLHDGNLFVTGRFKDLIIIGGRNHYPQDIERTVEQSHPALRPGSCAAFSIDVAGEEALIVLAEVDRRNRGGHRQHDGRRDIDPDQRTLLEADQIIRAIRQAVAEYHDLRVRDVLLLKSGSLSKTSSGKIQRYVCRSHFLQKTLKPLTR